jgi:hypothetical protein
MSDPVLAARDRLENNTSIALIVKRKLLSVQETAVAAVQLIGYIPMEKSNERGNSSFQEIIHKLAIMVNSGLVDGIISTTERNDSRPAEGESVCLSAY